jgi:hypothetical protein
MRIRGRFYYAFEKPSSGGGSSAVSEIDEHALIPKHIQSIIVLRIVGPMYVPAGPLFAHSN